MIDANRLSKVYTKERVHNKVINPRRVEDSEGDFIEFDGYYNGIGTLIEETKGVRTRDIIWYAYRDTQT